VTQHLPSFLYVELTSTQEPQDVTVLGYLHVIHTYITYTQAGRQADRQTDIQIDTDRQTDIQTDTDRQTYR